MGRGWKKTKTTQKWWFSHCKLNWARRNDNIPNKKIRDNVNYGPWNFWYPKKRIILKFYFLILFLRFLLYSLIKFWLKFLCVYENECGFAINFFNRTMCGHCGEPYPQKISQGKDRGLRHVHFQLEANFLEHLNLLRVENMDTKLLQKTIWWHVGQRSGNGNFLVSPQVWYYQHCHNLLGIQSKTATRIWDTTEILKFDLFRDNSNYSGSVHWCRQCSRIPNWAQRCCATEQLMT